jgi:pimeloyl-ACP methyl ester carboxylesterase
MSIRRAALWLLAGLGVVTAVAAARRGVPRILARIFQVRRAGLELSPDDLGLVAQDITIAGPNGATLRGWFAACPGNDSPRPAVLVIHGWNGAASLMLPIAPAIHAAGAHAFFLDARCHGRSDDDRFASMPRFAEDIEAGLRWLRGDPRVEPACAVLLGHSVGAGAALLVASRDPQVAAVVSIAAMAHPGTLMAAAMREHGVPAWVVGVVLREIERTVGLEFDTFAPVSTIAQVHAPVLLVHGERDEVVPSSDARRLEDASEGRARLLVLPEAAHASMDAFVSAAPTVTAFIASAARARR